MHDRPPVALFLGGHDPSSGAGICRDLRVAADFPIYSMSILTALTLQNGAVCSKIEPPSLDPLACLDALAPHLNGLWGVKLGLWALGPEKAALLARSLAQYAPMAWIWDPIQAPSSGAALHDRKQMKSLAESLLPHGNWILAPNAMEIRLLNPQAHDVEGWARPWLELGAQAVWLKGGHGEGPEIQDLWITPSGIHGLERVPRLPGDRRGTGCTLASAWLALRLLGREPMVAAREAAIYLRKAWPSAQSPGAFGRPSFFGGAES